MKRRVQKRTNRVIFRPIDKPNMVGLCSWYVVASVWVVNLLLSV